MSYEYKVVPAPVRGLKAKGVKTAEDRFALALQSAMNEQAADGWEYLRADTLPCEQREGLMSKKTVFQNMLVFRRTRKAGAPSVTTREPSLSAPTKKITQDTPDETLMLEKAPSKDQADATGAKPGKKPDVAAE